MTPTVSPPTWPYINDFLAIVRIPCALADASVLSLYIGGSASRWTREFRRGVECVKLTCPPQVYYRLTPALLARLDAAVVKLADRKGSDNADLIKARRIVDDLEAWLVIYGGPAAGDGAEELTTALPQPPCDLDELRMIDLIAA